MATSHYNRAQRKIHPQIKVAITRNGTVRHLASSVPTPGQEQRTLCGKLTYTGPIKYVKRGMKAYQLPDCCFCTLYI